jgi:hypothetical protein
MDLELFLSYEYSIAKTRLWHTVIPSDEHLMKQYNSH